MWETEKDDSPEPLPSEAALENLAQALNRIVAERKAVALVCSVCREPITPETPDICADDNGSPAHSSCYMQQVIASRKPPSPDHHA